jgi:hypothetical protein
LKFFQFRTRFQVSHFDFLSIQTGPSHSTQTLLTPPKPFSLHPNPSQSVDTAASELNSPTSLSEWTLTRLCIPHHPCFPFPPAQLL